MKNRRAKKTHPQAALRFALEQMKPYRWHAVWAVWWRMFFELLPMQAPVLGGAIIDGINGQAVTLYGLIRLPADPPRLLAVASGCLLALAAAYGVASYQRTTATARLSRKFVSGLRKALLAKLDLLSLELHARFGAGELLNRVVLDAQSLRRFIESGFARSFTNLVMIGYPLAMMLAMDWRLTLIALSVLPLQAIAARALQSKLHRALREARTTQSRLTSSVKESLDGVETLRGVSAGGEFTRRLADRAEQLEADELRSNRYTALISASVWALTGLGLALTWRWGGQRVLAGQMTLGALVTFTAFAALLYNPFRGFTNIVNVYRRGLVGLERIQEIFALPGSVADAPDAAPLRGRNWAIEFRDVHLQRGGRPVLNNIALTIHPRQLTVLMGESGSGKSSLLGLIARLYDPSDGCVAIDGQDLRGVTLQSLRARIAVVPQKIFLFSGTIADNIRLGRPDAGDADVERACRDAEAWGFISRLEHGLETKLGQGGATLSGGEAQRIALARALVRQPDVLLLDEPTSALDPQAEASIVALLSRLKTRMTIVLVAHHASAMRGADRIIRIHDGAVASDRVVGQAAAAAQVANYNRNAA
jgi:ABC-type multidrug transport system fused ATPase/permease subunit